MKFEQIEDVLRSFNGCTFASIDATTNVTLAGGKKNELQGRVTKTTANSQVILFSNTNSSGYENMVKRRLEEEGKNPDDFTSGPLPWGEWVKGTPFIKHKDKMYLRVVFNKAGTTTYYVDGVPTPKEDIEGLKEKPESSGQGGLENKVIPRNYVLESIDAIRVLGENIVSEDAK